MDLNHNETRGSPLSVYSPVVPEQESAVPCSLYDGECVQHVLDVHGQEEAQSRWFIAGWLQEPAEAALFTDM